MKMKRVMVMVVLALICVVHIAGCQKQINPATGKTEYRLDPNVAGDIEGGAAAGVTFMGVLANLFWPSLIPITTAAAGVLGTWAKIRPKYNTYRTESALYHDIAASTVEGIDFLKESNPESAALLLARLEEIKNKIISVEDRKKIENIIRGLRGLPLQT